jgi:hypothetical protein
MRTTPGRAELPRLFEMDVRGKSRTTIGDPQ